MEKEPLKILIADDHEIVLRGITQIVRDTLAGNVVIDTATRGSQAIDLASKNGYDLAMLDIEMPDTNGLDLIETFRTICPGIRIIVNTIHEELWYVKDYVHSGVNGILFKTVNADEISSAVVAVLDGEKYYCQRAKSLLRIIDGYERPTRKELEVLRLLATGKSTVEIAGIMGITVNTVESHRRHLLSKLDAHNVAELIMTAVSQGLLPVAR